MAELRVKVLVDRNAYDKSISDIESAKKRIEANPIQIKVEAAGIDQVTKNMISLANAQAKKAAADAKAIAAERQMVVAKERTLQIEKQLLATREKTTQQQEKTAQSYNKFKAEQQVTARATQDLAMAQEKTAQSANRASAAHDKLQTAILNQGNAAQKTTAYNYGLVESFIRFRVIGRVVNEFKNALSTMKAVDDELVTIRKVTDATATELEALTDRAYETGSKYGMGANDYLSNVAEFSRAGYKDAAADLGELAVKTQLVGDMSQQTAVQMLLSVDAAYKYKGSIDELSAVLDGMNEIDNNFATSMEKISAGLGKVAPIASQAGVGIDELSAAIGTVTAVTQRSGEEAATALRALFLNIMGDTKTEIADGATWTAGEIAGLRDVLNKYAPDAVAAAKATGELINPMEAIGGLSKAMKEGLLSEQELMQMVSDIGGKLRSSQLLALIQNWDMYNSMLTSFGGAVGSADREVSNALDSWSVKAARAKNVFAEMVSEFVDSKAIKTGFDIITDGLDNMENGIPKILSLAAAFKATQIALNGIGASRGLSALVSFVTGNWQALAITAALAAAYKLYDVFTTTAEEQKEQFEEANAAYQEEQTKLENINTELQTKQEKMQEILNMDSLTPKLQEELVVLQKQTEELRIQAVLQEAKAAASRTSLAKETVESAKGLAGDNGTIAKQLAAYQDGLEKIQKLSELSKQTMAELESAKSSGDSKAVEALRLDLAWINEEIQTERGYLDFFKAELASSYEQLDALDKTFTYLFAKEGYTHKSATDAYWNDETFFNSEMAFWLQAWDSVIASKEDAADVLGLVSEGLKDNAEKANGTADSLKKVGKSLQALADDASNMADETQAATDALAALEQKLKETGEVGDSFKQFQDAYATAMELFGKGMVGSREFQGIVDTILGDDIMRSLQWDYQKAGELLGNEFFQAMFTGGEEDFGRNAIQYLAENYGEITDASGRMVASFKETSEGVEVVVNDFEALADELGMSEDVLMTVFDAIGIFQNGLNTTSSDVLDLIDGLAKGVTELESGVRSVDFGSFVDQLAKMGKSEKEITQLYNVAKEMPEIEFTGDVSDVEGKIQQAVEDAKTFAESENDVKLTATNETTTVVDEAIADLDRLPKAINIPISASFSGVSGAAAARSAAGRGISATAVGTDNAAGGPTLVNELGPEIISENGRAYIANGGKPAVVDLSPGAIVLDAEETKNVRGAEAFGAGTIGAAAVGLMSNRMSAREAHGYGVKTQYTATVPKGDGDGKPRGSGGNSSGGGSDEPTEETDWWKIISDHYSHAADEAERAIDRIGYQLDLIEKQWEKASEPIEEQVDAFDKINDQIDRQIELLERERDALTKPLDEQIEALRKAKDVQDEQLGLAERQKAVEEARAALQNAQNERNIRYFNAEKGQWEWMADKGAVQNAQDSLVDAEKSLADYEYEMTISALERERDAIEAEYEKQLEGLEEKQLANEDAIYELEQQLIALEEKYEAIMKPLENEKEDQESALEAMEQQWADIELAAEEVEGDLKAALNAVKGTQAGKDASSLMNQISAHNSGLVEVPMSSLIAGSTATVPTMSGVLTGASGTASNNAVARVAAGSVITNSNNSNSNNTFYINGIKIESDDPMSLTLGDLQNMGIFENMND